MDTVPSAEQITRAASRLMEGLNTPVAKAAPVDEKVDEKVAKATKDAKDEGEMEDTEKAMDAEAMKALREKKGGKAEKDDEDDDKEKDDKKVEKAVALTEVQLETLLSRAMSVGFEHGVRTAEAAVEKSLGVVSEKLETIGRQVESTMRYQYATTDVLAQFKEKSSAVEKALSTLTAEVVEQGNQPAPRRTAPDQDVAKSHSLQGEVDLSALEEITKSMSIEDASLAKRAVNKGLFDQSGLSKAQLERIGVK